MKTNLKKNGILKSTILIALVSLTAAGCDNSSESRLRKSIEDYQKELEQTQANKQDLCDKANPGEFSAYGGGDGSQERTPT